MKKKLINLFFSVVALFLFCDCVYAFDGKVSDDLFFNCTVDNKCVPLCVYGNNDALIAYYYDSSDYANGSGWNISFRTKKLVFDIDGITWNVLDSSSYKNVVYYSNDSFVPKSGIYSADEYLTNGRIVEDWNDSELYNSLKNSFVCPKFFAIDMGSNPFPLDPLKLDAPGSSNEICLSSKKGDCAKIDNGFGTNFNRGDTFELKYSLNNKLDYVNSYVYNERNLTDKSAEVKMQFVDTLDDNLNFDPLKSLIDNVKNNCSYFEKEINSDGGKKYVEKLMSSNYVSGYFDDLNVSYMKADDSYVPANAGFFDKVDYQFLNTLDSNIFNYDVLKNMLIVDQKEYRNDAFKKVDHLLEDNIVNSLEYVSSVCSQDGAKIKIDEYGVRSTVDKNYNLMRFNDPVINFDDKYSCNDIFTEEMIDIIKTAYFLLEMVGLAILVVLSSLDYAKIFLNDNADELKKANSNLLKRLIIVVILFLLPAFINFMLRIFKIEGINSDHPLCIEISNK